MILTLDFLCATASLREIFRILFFLASLRKLPVVFPDPVHHEEHEVLLSLFVSLVFFRTIIHHHLVYFAAWRTWRSQRPTGC